MRGDLADIRVADRFFAPHYAAPMPRRLREAAGLRQARFADSDLLASLAAGEIFEVLDLSGGNAWGVAPQHGLVGYVPAAALEEAAS